MPADPSPSLARSAGALAGVKVVDLTRVLGGPYCTMVLSDHGAEVIKVEPPQGDEVRDWGPPYVGQADGTQTAAYFAGVNRNKQSISLDLARPAGREVLLRLLADADVLVENFKPGAMERWGLGYGSLSERFPRLVHCRVSGFGADGPLGGLPGYDAVLQAMVGLMSINGDETTGPMRMGAPVVDMGTGLYSAVAILMAVIERQRSGLGQFLDMTLHDCGMALLHPQAANYLASGRRPVPTGNPHPNLAPYERYRTRTGDVFIAVGNNGQFRKLCETLGAPALADDPRFATNADRIGRRGALIDALDALLAGRDGPALCIELLRAGVPAGPVLPIDEAVASPHAAHREMVTELDGRRGLGTPIKMSRTPGGLRSGPPSFAEHARDVLGRHGYGPDEIDALVRDGAVCLARRS